jgi:hypothetical protein
MTDQSVYLLETFRFMKQFRRFTPANVETFPDFFPDRYRKDAPWTPPRFANTWTPQKLIGDVWPGNDFPGAGAPVNLTPVFSARAVEGLREFLEPNGELLPLITPEGSYFAYNLTRVVDAMDVEGTVASWVLPTVSCIERFEFRPETLRGLTIFKIPQTPVEIYVTDPFVQRVRELGLNGMWITRLWPMQPGEKWTTRWNEELNKMKSADAKPKVVKVKAKPKATLKPKVLDLREDVPAVEQLLKKLATWIAGQQKGWSARGESLCAIGIELTGWDMDDGPMLMCNLDTRQVPGHDGNWTYLNQLHLKRPKWGKLLQVEDHAVHPYTLIDVRGTKHSISTGGDLKTTWFGEVVAEAIKKAKADGVFDKLLKKEDCEISVEDPESDFFWPGSQSAAFKI